LGIPIRNLNELLANWDTIEYNANASNQLFAFFLYTDEDENIARYVRKFFREIDMAAGNDCKIFLIERPPKSYIDDEERKEWVEKLIVNEVPEQDIMQIPEYDRATAYKIAGEFNIDYSEMPCIAFFKDLESNDFIIYNFDNTSSDQSITGQLRAIFDAIKIKEEVPFILRRGHRWENLKRFMERKRRERRNARIIHGLKTLSAVISGLKEARETFLP
jgi:hypothetical protein